MRYLMKNRYMLKNVFRRKNGYDWWWHSFVGIERETGVKRSFFIEYYIINPGISRKEIICGQTEENLRLDKPKKPSYAMIKAGTWGIDKCQINNYYPMRDVRVSNGAFGVEINENQVSDTKLIGSVNMSEEDAINHPEYMTDSGTMSWNLKLDKTISYSVGYGASRIFRMFNLFEMFWHVQGMRTQLEGEVVLNGVVYDVEPDSSYGYQDKNYGSGYTNPWVWLNSNNLFSVRQNKELKLSSMVTGGGNPKVLGISLGRKLMIAFNYEGHLYEYNFSKFWKKSKTSYQVIENSHQVIWKIRGENSYSKILMRFTCEKEDMIHVNYESPRGVKDYDKLFNGGTAKGVIKIYEKNDGVFELFDVIKAQDGGCEFGEY